MPNKNAKSPPLELEKMKIEIINNNSSKSENFLLFKNEENAIKKGNNKKLLKKFGSLKVDFIRKNSSFNDTPHHPSSTQKE